MQDEKKYLIIGGGLSGLSLALHFYENNVAFEILTKEENHSSLIAAGLINPIVFRRTTKSWEVDALLPYAKAFYKKAEQLLQRKIWNDLIIRRSFSHQQELDEWQKKKEKPAYSEYLGEINTPCPENLYQEYGTGMVKNAAWISTKDFVSGMRNFFFDNKQLRYIAKEEQEVVTDRERYKGIIYCEGYEMIHNPLFNHLPLDPTKGQILTVKSDEIPQEESINRKCFVLPTGDHQFRVGATYEWSDSSLNITDEAKELLENDLNNLIAANYEIVNQQAGVRPTVKDRRPILGEHPDHKNNYVFNGLGTKGYLIAPLMAKWLYDFLIDGREIPEEVTINRFYKK